MSDMASDASGAVAELNSTVTKDVASEVVGNQSSTALQPVQPPGTDISSTVTVTENSLGEASDGGDSPDKGSESHRKANGATIESHPPVTYINSLEKRVNALEKKLKQLTAIKKEAVKDGSVVDAKKLEESKDSKNSKEGSEKKKRDGDGDEHITDSLGLCHDHERPMIALRMGMRKWITESTYRLSLREAILFLAFNESLDSLPGLQRTNSAAGGGMEAGYSSLARFAINSCWASVVITLFSGVSIRGYANSTLVYPFKYMVLYAKQIKRFSEILNDVQPEEIAGKDLPDILTRITKEVLRSVGSNRINAEYSDTKTTGILRGLSAFDNHFKRIEKAEKTSTDSKKIEKIEKTEKTEKAEKVEKTENGDPDNIPTTAENPLNSDKPESSADALAPDAAIPFSCTCLNSAKLHLKVLSRTIEDYLSPIISLRQSLVDSSESAIRFRDLWLLYQPGELVISAKRPHQAFRIIHVSGGRPLMTNVITEKSDKSHSRNEYSDHKGFRQKSKVSPFTIDCIRYDFDGEKFGPVQQTVLIEEYDGEKAITILKVYPLRFAGDSESIKKTLIQRGQRFSEFQTFQHRRYEGLSLDEPQEEIESEVIIDFALAFRQPDYAHRKPQIGLQGPTEADARELFESLCGIHDCTEADCNQLNDDTVLDRSLMNDFINDESHSFLKEVYASTEPLNEEQLILLPHCVHAFSLRNRNWVPLSIEYVQDIRGNDAIDGQNAGFEDLVIREEYKKTVKALVANHALGPKSVDPGTKASQQMDLVRGKGKGLIILLHGVPGVGKTSTAESVAAYTRRPLFPITCGDIGQTAEEVEKKLQSIFLLARKWGCVLLLDEADVFLAKRAQAGDNIERNALVSVFLRVLEYYSGILFLTTNRIGTFDEAFISRIHMSLYYPKLDEDFTYKIWMMNLDRLKRSGQNIYVNDEHIKLFARNHWRDGHRWNGRQIRNAFQTAIALAEYDFADKCRMCEETGDRPPLKPVLEPEHFRSVAQTSAEFDSYIQRTHGGETFSHTMEKSYIRNDRWEDRGMETPTGKKYSNEKAIRPSPMSNRNEQPPPPSVYKPDPNVSIPRSAPPPLTPSSSNFSKPTATTASMGLDESEAFMQFKAKQLQDQAEKEEFEKFKKEMEKKREEEKQEKFRKWLEMEQRAGR